MPTTTNFGWTTPADTDLVKDGALAIRTLGNGIDTSLLDLKGGTTGQVLSKASNTDLDFTWVAQDDSNAIQNAIIDAKGDLIVGTAADTPARLAVGTNGHVLTADSTAASGVKWAAAAAGGKVLQVVSATHSTATTIATTTYTDSGLTVSITPSATSSKVLILATQSASISKLSTGNAMGIQLVRGSTVINGGVIPWQYQNIVGGATSVTNRGIYTLTYLDSPSTTSSTTYKIQMAVEDTNNSQSITAQHGSSVSSIIVLEIGA